MKKCLGIFFSICGVLLCSAPVHGTCPENFQEMMGGCFLFPNRTADYLTSRVICQEFGGDLAIVNDCNLLGSVSTYLESLGLTSNAVWIGATDVLTEGVWKWLDGIEVTFGVPFWARVNSSTSFAEPSGGTAENCTMMATGAGFSFQDVNCQSSIGMAPLCQTESVDGSCPPPYVNVSNTCFQFLHSLDLTWDDARTVCQSNFGDLAVLSDCVLMTNVINYISSTGFIPATGYWIGGTDVEVEGTWKWITGQTMAMGVPFWGRDGTGPLEPNNVGDEDCLAMIRADRYLFNDYNCTRVHKFLCQATPF